MNEVVTESVEENDMESVIKQQVESSSKSNETEADIEETVTRSAIIGDSEESSEVSSINERTTVSSRNIEEIVTLTYTWIEAIKNLSPITVGFLIKITIYSQ